MDNIQNLQQSLGGQLGPILGAVAILLVGWIVALIAGACVRKVLGKLSLNNRLSSSVGQSIDAEHILARVIFWFVLIIAIVASFNLLNLHSVSEPFSNMINEVLVYVPRVLSAAIIAIAGWLLAFVVRAGLTKVLSSKLEQKLTDEVGVQTLSNNIAEIVYWLIILLFLPLVLSALGLNGLLAPVQNLVNSLLQYLPNIFAAAVIGFVGYFVAKIVRNIVTSLISSMDLQACAEKVGVKQTTSLPNIAGSIVFLLILVPSLIAALDALKIEAISKPAVSMLNEIMYAIPQVIAAALILIVTYAVSRFVSGLVSGLLAGTGVDDVPAKVDLQRFLGNTKVSDIVGYLIVFFAMLFAVIEAANRLGFDQVSHLITVFIAFGANILLGVAIFLIGAWLANIVGGIVQRGEESSWLATLVRVLIIGLVLAMGLRAMGIADSIVNMAFGLTLGAVSVAFALAFGLGGREPAQRVLTDFIDKCKENCKKD